MSQPVILRSGLEISALEVEGYVHQADEHGHLYQGADDRSEGLSGADAEYRHSYGDGQLEVVAGSSEGEARRLGIVSSYSLAHVERDQEHDHEVNKQRYGDSYNI